MEKLLQGLNAEQREAVVTIEGPLLVLAGAGTGKTRVITVRIAWMLAHRIDPTNVLAMTFTNKAAAEMRERVAALVGPERAKLLTVGTFHAFCARFLREHAADAGLSKTFTIADEGDQLSALRGALRELAVAEATVQPSFAQSRISLAKNRLQTPESFLNDAADDREELIGRAWQRYEERLKRSNQVDFDDLLVHTVRVLKTKKAVREKLEARYRYVLVDEYQDTNAPQYEILRLIAKRHANLCVVGDDDQSIYGWRGADVKKILGFEKDFPGAKVVRLETNYRSTRQVISAANAVIKNNPSRHEKELRSSFGDGEHVMVVAAEDEMAEADHVVRDLQSLVRAQRAVLKDIAILFRSAVQTRPFEAALRARAVPYHLVGGMSFFDRKEVRDVLAYLKLAANPKDEASLMRVINTPPRGVGKTTIERLLEVTAAKGESVPDLLTRDEAVEGVPAEVLAGLRAFHANLADLGRNEPGKALVSTVTRVLDVVGYKGEVERNYPDKLECEQRWQSVMEVLNFAENYVRRAAKPSLGGFLEELTLSAEDRDDKDKEAKGDKVTLMTLHAAKGLEFPRVYLVGLEEGLLPHQRAVEEGTVEEERRLAYVGVTRARMALTLTWSRSRSKFGKRAESYASRFLYEMKNEQPPKEWRAAAPAGARAEPSRGSRSGTRRGAATQRGGASRKRRTRV
ncbi:MAG: UvrD-helicase domain-containing protein [Planctomycetes bacterium]|nr:UvrD-helicase domain-containing protein [Planctomycetota bacterium]